MPSKSLMEKLDVTLTSISLGVQLTQHVKVFEVQLTIMDMKLWGYNWYQNQEKKNSLAKSPFSVKDLDGIRFWGTIKTDMKF